MYIVDRSLAIIRPRQPFANWLNQVPDNDMQLTLEQLRSDCTTLLIPEYNEPEDGIAFIDEIYSTLFEMELASWYEDQRLWPQQRSLKMFWEWFDVELCSTVMDALDTDIQNTPVYVDDSDSEQ